MFDILIKRGTIVDGTGGSPFEGDVAIWDNRCTMHYALKDYGDDYRAMHRLTIKGEVPV